MNLSFRCPRCGWQKGSATISEIRVHWETHEPTYRVDFKYVSFMAGTLGDPKPAENERRRRYGRCLKCNKILQFLPIANLWIDDDDNPHTGHMIEFPEEWLPK